MLKISVFFLLFQVCFFLDAQQLPRINSDCKDCQLNNLYQWDSWFYVEGGDICCNRNWELIFFDEFDGESLDTSKWATYFYYNDYKEQGKYNGHSSRVHENRGSYFKDENVSVGNGICTLSTKIETVNFPEVCFNNRCMNKAFFTSGMLMSKRWFENFHRYEIRCKVPKGSEMWTAFWVFGWSTEIDVFEFIKSSSPEFSVHKWLPDIVFTSNSGKMNLGELQESYHTYAVEHDKFHIKWYIDENLIFQVPLFNFPDENQCNVEYGLYWKNKAFPDCNVPALQIITDPGVAPEAQPISGVFPKNFLIDYIRVYKYLDVDSENGCDMRIKGPTSICERIDTLEYCLEGGKMIGGNWELPTGLTMYQNPSLTITKKIVIVNGEEVIKYDTIKNENCIKVIANGYYGNNSIKYNVNEECKFLMGETIEKKITFGRPGPPKVNITRLGCTEVVLCVENPEDYSEIWFSGTTPRTGNCQTIPVEFSYKFPYNYVFVEVSNECGKYLEAIKIDGSNCLGLTADDKIGFEITPNPAQDEINIKIDQNFTSDSESNFVECQILSLNTGTIMSKINISQQNEIYVNTSNYSTGEYLVLLKNLQGSFISDKLIINRF